MLHDRRRPPIPLPKGWQRHVRSAVLHVISLAQFAVAHTRGWAVNGARPCSTGSIQIPSWVTAMKTCRGETNIWAHCVTTS